MLLSFIYVPRERVFHFKSEGGMVLLSFLYFRRHCVIHFKSEGHRWAWVDCVVLSELFSTSMCHSFRKRGLPVGFLVSACRPRLVGLLLFFTLSSFLIINLLTSSILQWLAHMFQFLSAWSLKQGRYVCECSMHTSDSPGAMALQMLIHPILAYAKGAFCVPAPFTRGTQKHPFACANCTICASTVFCEETQKHPFACTKGPFRAGNESRVGRQIGAFTHAKAR